MDEMEKDLEMKMELVRKFVSHAGLNNAAESALEEMAEFSQDYGEGMEDFKSYLSDIKEHGFDMVEYPLYSTPIIMSASFLIMLLASKSFIKSMA